MIERYIGEENAMAIKVLELHHHGIRVGATQEDADKTMKFYADVLGLSHDPGRPTIPTIPGYWMDVGGRAQIHLMGVNGQSKFHRVPGRIPRCRTSRSPFPTSRRRERSSIGSAPPTGYRRASWGPGRSRSSCTTRRGT